MFVGHGAQPYRADTLRLYYSDELKGPWLEHPASPIVIDDVRTARPAGRVVSVNGEIIRFSQDCWPAYGTRVRAFEVTHLSTNDYREREVEQSPVLQGSGAGWNGYGMHHIDAHQTGEGSWVACVDGWTASRV